MTLLEWIKELGGAAKAAAAFKETTRTVQSWIYGEKIPKPQTAQRLVSLSKGKVDFNGVYAPLFALQAERAAKAMIRKGMKSD